VAICYTQNYTHIVLAARKFTEVQSIKKAASSGFFCVFPNLDDGSGINGWCLGPESN